MTVPLDDKEEEHQEEEIAEDSDSDSDATVTKDLGKVPGKYLTKISELLKKKKKQLMAQYNRVLKQRDDNDRDVVQPQVIFPLSCDMFLSVTHLFSRIVVKRTKLGRIYY
jgi:hypothetical protein